MHKTLRAVARCLLASSISVCAIFSLPAQAQTSPTLTNGVQWLSAQVQADGSLLNEATSIATPLQSRSESFQSLRQFASVSVAQSNLIAADTDGNTEYLARQIVTLGSAGIDTSAMLTQLAASNNPDGGYGGAPGYASTPLSTAFALIALRSANATAPVPAAIAYLQSVQQADGSFQLDNRADLYSSIYVLSALRLYAGSAAVSSNIQLTTNYLMAQQSAPGIWNNSVFLTALAYPALHDFIPLAPTSTAISAFLLANQQADGSWGDDPYTTALVLRCLPLTTVAPANPGLAQIKGLVQDAQTRLPLAGVVVTGSNGIALASDATGGFIAQNLPVGAYQLALTLSQYQTLNTSFTLQAGQVLDLGTLLMTKGGNATTGTVFGVIKDAVSSQPISGASVSVNGAASAVTDASGAYQVSNVPIGSITLQASKLGYATVVGSGTVAAGNSVIFSPVMTASTGSGSGATMQGVVLSAANNLPLAGVSISLTGSNTATTTTNAQGQYSFSNLTSGALQVTASLAGYDTVVANAQANPNGSISFSPKMYPAATTPAGQNAAAVQGVVMDAGSSMVLPGVQVTLSVPGSADASVTTGADGRFSFPGITAASVTLTTSLPKYVSSVVQVSLEPLQTLDVGQIRLRAVKVTQELPDIAVTNIDRTAAVTDPQSLQLSGYLTVTLQNVGFADVPAGIKVLAFQDINNNRSYDAGIDQALGTITLTASLPVGQTQVVQVPVQGQIPFRDAPVMVWADSGQTLVEISKANNLRSTSDSIQVIPNPAAFAPVLKWQWTGGVTMPTYNQVEMTPMVAPTGSDKTVPSIIFVSYPQPNYSDGILRIISGKDGSELVTVTDPAYRLSGLSNIAVGDIDGSGEVTIIAQKADNGLIAFSNTGAVKWTANVSQFPLAWHCGAISIANLDGSGKASIIYGNTVFNYDGTVRWQGTGPYLGDNYHQGQGYGGIIVPMSNLADINLTGRPQLIAGASAYDAGGNLLWQNAAVGDGYTAIANFTGAANPQIVVVSNGRVFLLDHTGAIIWGPVYLPTGGHGGAPVIADMDGDGSLEIGVAGMFAYTVLNADGSIKWSKPTYDVSSTTGSSVFDFAGDGKAKVLYGDQEMLRVYDGATGDVVFSFVNSSDTSMEMPIVADVDNDGHADLVVPQSGGAYAGLRVYQDVNNSWVNTRRIWNQYGYHITNINEDGTVPAVEQNSWQANNNYRLNARIGVAATAVPDVTASFLRVNDQGGQKASTFTVRIGNASNLPLDAGVNVAFYSGQAGAGGVLLGVVKTTIGLANNQYQDVALNYAGSLSAITTLVAVADDNGAGVHALNDFNIANNTVSMPLSVSPGSFNLTTVGTDQPSYAANSNVQIAATIANHGSFDGSAQINFVIQTTSGQQVAVLPTQTVAIAHVAQQTVNAVWNDGTIAAGSYVLVVQLLDGNGLVCDHASTTFVVTSSTGSGTGTTVASVGITTDKQTYLPTDTVMVADRLTNLTANTTLNTLNVLTTVSNPAGAVVFSKSEALAQLPSGALKDYSYNLPLRASPPGSYNATVQVTDSNGTTLAQNAARFTVATTSASGNGLIGSVSVGSPQVPVGSALVITYSATNDGNSALTGVPMTLNIVDPVAQKVMASFPTTQTLAMGTSYAGSANWTSAGVVGNTYVAVLTATVGGNTLTLGQANFTLFAPPIKLAITQSLWNSSRVLVLTPCVDSNDSDDNDDDHRSGGGHHGDNGNDGHKAVTCVSSRNTAIQKSLTALGVPYLVTTDTTAFTVALRSGLYNTIWLNNLHGKLDDDLANEIGEVVYGGASLIQDGLNHSANKSLYRLGGVQSRHSVGKNLSATLGGSLYPSSTVLPTVGKAQSLKLTGSGQMQGSFTVGKGDDQRGEDDNDGKDGHDGNGDQGNQGNGNDDGNAGNNGNNTPQTVPAIVSNAVGSGHTLTLGFDLGLTLVTGGDAWNPILAQSLAALTPAASASLSPGALLPVQTGITNQGDATALEVDTLLPAGAMYLGSTPAATLNATTNTADWTFNLPVAQSNALYLTMRAPAIGGSYTLQTVVSTANSGSTTAYGNPLSLPITVTSAAATAAAQVAALQAYPLTREDDKDLRDALVQNLNRAMADFNRNTQQSYASAIDELVEVAGALKGLSTVDTGAVHAGIDSILQEAQWRWTQAAPAPTDKKH